MDNLDTLLGRQARDQLPLFVRIFVFIYLLIGVAHLLLLPPELVLPMTSLAFLSVAIGVVVYLFIEQPAIQEHAELVMLGLLLLMGVNTMTHMFFSADVRQTTNFIFVMAVAGYFLPSFRAFYGALIALIGSWVTLVMLSDTLFNDAVHYGFELLLGMMFAVFLHTLKRNQARQRLELEASINQLRESQAQLDAGESLMQHLIDEIPAGILVRSVDTRILYVNDEAKRVLERTDEQLLGKKVGDDGLEFCDINGDPVGQDQAPVKRVLESGNAIRDQIFSIRTSVGLKHGLVHAFLLQISDVDVEDVVVVAFVDITQRLDAESLLRDSERRAQIILDSVSEGIVAVDSKNQVQLFNPGAQVLTGLTEREAIGKDLAEVLNFQQDESSIERSEIRQGLLQRVGGEEIAVELLVSDLREEDTTGHVYTIRDVRDQLQFEQEQATVEKMNSLGLMAGGIAHDFNNLLAAIYGNLALAEASIDEKQKATGYLKRSSESLQMATNLTKQLLTFATGSDPIVTVVDSEKLVREAARFALSGSSVAVSFSFSPDVWGIRVEAGQMQQAVSNIVLNARQAMNDNGVIRISIENCMFEEPMVSVAIKDDGPGIPVDLQANIFDPYFTTKSTGTGLGLATTHSIIQKHGGSISIDSSEEYGTTFTLLLPATGERYQQSDTPADDAQPQSRSLEILVMDDDEVVLQTITDMLTHLGHRVFQTRDGEEAISAYLGRMERNEAFDLVVVDLTVAGGMGGLDASQGILRHDGHARIIVSSGYSAGAEMSRYKELGFSGRLSKPYRFAELEAVLEQVVAD